MKTERFERASYHFEAINRSIGDHHQLGFFNTSILLNHIQMIPHPGYIPIQGRLMQGQWEEKKNYDYHCVSKLDQD